MTDKTLKLNRKQLASFLPNHEAIIAFESLFNAAAESLPTGIEDVELSAETAQIQAAQALAGLAEVAQNLSLLLLAPFKDTAQQDLFLVQTEAAAQDNYLPNSDQQQLQESFVPPSVEQIAQQVLDLISAQIIEAIYAPPNAENGTIAAQNANNVNISGGKIEGTPIGQASPANGNFTLLSTPNDTNNYGLVAGRFSVGYAGAAISTRAAATFLALQVAGTECMRVVQATQALLVATATDDGINKLQVAGGIKQALATALISTGVAMNNGAAAAVGTLTNAPVAGNPTKWIPINDNGTTRYIPTW